MNSNSKKDIERHIEDVVNAAFTQGHITSRIDPTRVQYLRVSSFPFCARAWFLAQPEALGRARREDAKDLYYTSVGTAVHEVFQSGAESLAVPAKLRGSHDTEPVFLPRNSILIQDWICVHCHHRTRFSPHPTKCAWCGSSKFRGAEHQVRYSRRVLGHMDGTFAFPEKGESYSKDTVHIPMDYKTCSAAALKSNRLPYEGNKDQLLSYGAIKQSEGYNVPGVALVYVCRDNPNNRRVIALPLDGDAQRKKIAKYEKAYEAAEKCRDLDTAMALPTKTKSDFADKCGYCRFRKPCEASFQGKPKFLEAQVNTVLLQLKRRDETAFPSR